MSPANQRLINHLHYILISHWDPIGVGDEPNAQDEYDSYIPYILSELALDADSETIAALLYQIETQRMGLSGDVERAHHIAAAIMTTNQLHRHPLIIPCYTRVRLVTDRYRDKQAPCGTVGCVIEIYAPDAYEVECSREDGITFAQVVVHPDELIPDEPLSQPQ